MDKQKLTLFRSWLKESRRMVFFGGAGVSTESGIPDFRSVDGLYHQKYDYPPETILSHSFFVRQPEEFYRFYRNKMLFPDALPSRTHRCLAALEQAGRLTAVVTQNVDGLHQKAGSKRVLELHGSVHRNYCARCRKPYDLSFMLHSEGVPRCSCGGIIRPDVVLYEEGLDQQVLESAIQAIWQADLLVVGGTSLTVYPAAGLLQYYRGNRLVLINRSPTPRDDEADLLLPGSLGDVFTEACRGILPPETPAGSQEQEVLP